MYFMKKTEKANAYFFLFWIMALLTSMPGPIFAQAEIKGRVIYEKDETPAQYATVELLKQKDGSLTDKNGHFSFYIFNHRNDDTLLISSVGYETLKIPVATALKRSEYVLTEKAGNLETVIVKSFTNHDVQGSRAESVGYYRSWNTNNSGGEIGRIFRLPYREFKIDKIRFKVSNLCDTCLLRLHIRELTNGRPGEEIIKDSITTTISKLTLDDKVPEFDISTYDYTFTQPELFVSLEVINCSSKKKETCYFSFAGTEKGEYIYKSRAVYEWQNTSDYTIYLKLFLRY